MKKVIAFLTIVGVTASMMSCSKKTTCPAYGKTKPAITQKQIA